MCKYALLSLEIKPPSLKTNEPSFLLTNESKTSISSTSLYLLIRGTRYQLRYL